ncbi:MULTISPECIES: GNAT family N-acetyltransferase [Pantoea]|uniref:GNAT family N-acetyltransferase n=1 Tax=Pantoea TaxID=53335 RepID=UPI0007C7AD68|nr:MULTISPECIES: GNAT family N-acetyltransferase [Pantoea]MDJ0042724.1 GNAT family N-acetyltransferase [Pantoea allii]OAE08150.1 acetyltransferase [Pantoea sp. OXWO6B1]TWD35158.1 RimJ/RimL family protein N-acetyltransferase [Pantoea sp. SJZ147]
MYLDDIPLHFLQHENFYLIAPDMSRTEEMQQKLNAFSSLHHEFLLWSPGFHSLDSVKKNMAEAADNFLNDREEYKFLIIDRQSDELVGCISLFIRNRAIPYYEIGYWLATDVLGKGIMSEACKQVTNIASAFLQAKRIEIRTAGRNLRSQSVALKCGFKREATLVNERLDGLGRIDDTFIYRYDC